MQENSLNIREQKIERIISLCAKGRYGEAVELLANSSSAGIENLSHMPSIADEILNALHEWEIENTCVNNGVDCCCDDGCLTCTGVCCCLPLCGLCCITVFDGGDIAQNVIVGSIECCGDKFEKVFCNCCCY